MPMLAALQPLREYVTIVSDTALPSEPCKIQVFAQLNAYHVSKVAAGHGCGRLRGNRHVRCLPATPLANVLLTIAQRLDVDLDRIGDSTGEIAI